MCPVGCGIGLICKQYSYPIMLNYAMGTFVYINIDQSIDNCGVRLISLVL